MRLGMSSLHSTTYTGDQESKTPQTTQTNVRSTSRRQLSQAAGTLLLLLLHRLVYCKATLSLPCADTERGPAAGTTGGLSEDCPAHDNDNATPRSAASFSQRPHGRYHCACLVLSCLVLSSVITRRPICHGGPYKVAPTSQHNCKFTAAPAPPVACFIPSWVGDAGALELPCLCCCCVAEAQRQRH